MAARNVVRHFGKGSRLSAVLFRNRTLGPAYSRCAAGARKIPQHFAEATLCSDLDLCRPANEFAQATKSVARVPPAMREAEAIAARNMDAT